MKIKKIWGLGGSVLLLSVQITAIVGIAMACYLALYLILNSKPHRLGSYSSGTSANAIAEPALSASPSQPTALAKTANGNSAVGAHSVEPGSLANRFDKHFPMLARPSGPFISNPAGGTIDGVNYRYILDNGSYTVTSALQGSVMVTGKAILYVPKTGTINFNSRDVIKIAKGASLTFCNDSGADAVFGDFSNDNKQATNFLYYALAGADGCKTTFHVGNEFYGALYAPHQDLILVGNSDRHNDFYGSVVGNTVTLLTSKD